MKSKISIFKFSMVLILTISIGFAFMACGNMSGSKQMNYNENTIGKEAKMTEQNQTRLLEKQPPTQVEYSNERQNLDKRNTEWNNPNKLGYVYTLSTTGTIISFYTIKGKVSSVNSMLTTNTQLVKDPNHYASSSEGSLSMESPNLDGSYGTNGDGIFFYTTEGVYVEWNGYYQLSSEPLKMSTKPILTYEVKDKKKD